MKIKAKYRRTVVATLIAGLSLSQTLWAASAIDDSPSEGAMVGDLLVARPVGAVLTVVGTAAFVISLPFTLLGGNASQAAETLMIGPAKTTFVRCLGCTEPGYSYKDIEKNKQNKEMEQE